MLLVKLFGKLPLEIKEYLILNHILPWLTACTNGIILEKGYNLNNIKVSDKNEDNFNNYLDQGNVNKTCNFNPFTPDWVSKSFTDPSKHPIYTGKPIYTHTSAPVYECPCDCKIPCDCDVVFEQLPDLKSNDPKDISNYSVKVLSLLSKLINKE